MPYPSPPRSPSGPRRRTLLASAAAGAALLVGCSSGSEDSDGTTSGSPSLTERARARAARDSEGLVARYDAVLAAHPVLAELVGPLRAQAVRHVEAFGGGSSGSPGTSGPSASSSTVSKAPQAGKASPSSSPSATVPATEQGALAELAAAERELADRRAKELLHVPGELARLLASVAAAGAAHAYLLTEGAK
ncbi:hypothetical protein SAMN04487981_13110 [Streptomyces sp. cf386]|uniref:hypothetical protein n=1 Tax=Streptomyces sp. cf386 TaxID=1761904 RepID=UPI0008896B49|nr:hypothetical protein [Streptomyces sp. cf386]SDP65050.1 hypothetical protein SAMN04487981_13110 [Streptomyces sp. cf386]